MKRLYLGENCYNYCYFNDFDDLKCRLIYNMDVKHSDWMHIDDSYVHLVIQRIT